MRKHFLLLFLMALLPLAGWAQGPEFTLAIDGTGISGNAGAYTAYYKGAVYAPNVTVTWNNAAVTDGFALTWEKKVGNDFVSATASDVKNAGVYKLTATYTPQGYDQQTASVTLTINQVNVTVAAVAVNKKYGEADGALTATVTYPQNNPVEGETVAYSVARAEAFANTVDASENPYANAIHVTVDNTAAVNANYNITAQDANLTIGKATVTITAKPKSITYGANLVNETASFDYDIDGLVDATGTELAKNYLLTAHEGITGTLSLTATIDNTDLDATSGKLKYKNGGYPIVVTAPTDATNYEFQVANNTLTVNKATLYVKVKDEAITYGTAVPQNYSFVYQSGLMSQAEITAYVGDNNAMQGALLDATNVAFTYPEPTAPATFVNQGSYDVTATGLTAGNYNVLINKGTLTINKKSLADATVAVVGTLKYNGGAEVKPGVTVNFNAIGDLTNNKDYTVQYFNNTKAKASLTQLEQAFKKAAPTHQDANATADLTDDEITFPYVVISAKDGGNYSGTSRKAFTIQKADLTITADDKSVALGGTPAYTATIGAENADLLESNAAAIKAALQAGQTVEGFTGTLQFSCLGGNNVGQYDIMVSGLTADNYTITYEKGTLNVTPGTLPLKVVVNNAIYGQAVTAANNFTFAFDENGEGASAISDVVKSSVVQLVGAENVTYTIKNSANETVPVADWTHLPFGTYTVSASAQHDDYTLNFADGTLQVTKKNLTITIVNQEVNLYDENGTTPVMNDLYGNNGVVNLNAVLYDDDANADAHTAYDPTNAPNGYTIKIEGLETAAPFNDDIAGLNIDRLTATVTTIGSHTNAISYGIEEGKEANPNYNYVVTGGQLTINGLVDDSGADGVKLTMAKVAEKIATYDQQTVAKVTVTFDPTVTIANATTTLATSEWKAEKWYTMVLPFETTVAALSKAIGYAIVNVVDADHTTTNNIKFQLTMGTLPANKPFMIKTAEAITAPKALVFEDVKIENATAPSVDAGQGYKLFGTYGTKEITNADQDLHFLFYHLKKDNVTIDKTTWDYISSDNVTATINAFNAWADLSPAQNSHEVTFTFEEIDGSTTSIKAVDFNSSDNAMKTAEGWYTIDGMKLQAAPTEKGIYIKNGKKVVLK